MVAKYNSTEGVYLGVWPVPGANEIDVAKRLRDEMERIRQTLPKDIDMRLVWDGTMFMRNALTEITKTLSETILIVALVVFLFMGSVRTALVPLVAIPVSLIGAALFMFAFGFSLNLLTLLAIVLSVGLVVDDAIVVVKNVERHVRQGKSRIEAALAGAHELIGPIIAMAITLATVYTPIGLPGTLTGSLFLEFAVTLAVAVVLSGVVAVTLSPVVRPRFVHPSRQGRPGWPVLVNPDVRAGAPRMCAAARRRVGPALGQYVPAAVLIMVAAWPLYLFSRQKPAPIKDQSHISLFFEASADSTAGRHEPPASPDRGCPLRSFPETEFTWSLTTVMGRLWRTRRKGLACAGAHDRTGVRGPGLWVLCRKCRACACSPVWTRRSPRPVGTFVEFLMRSDVPADQMLGTGRGGPRRRMAERKVFVRGYRSEDRSAGSACQCT